MQKEIADIQDYNAKRCNKVWACRSAIFVEEGKKEGDWYIPLGYSQSTDLSG